MISLAELPSYYIPTGEFVPERVWSCPVHDDPVEHYCDCDLCAWEEPECCAGADWVDRLDADGNVVMRELTPWDLMFRQMVKEDGLLSAISQTMFSSGKVEWLEDTLLPRSASVGG